MAAAPPWDGPRWSAAETERGRLIDHVTVLRLRLARERGEGRVAQSSETVQELMRAEGELRAADAADPPER